MLSPDEVGHRVVVRRVVGHRDGRPLLSDALGVLLRITERDLVIETARGPVTVARAAVVAAKRVPPRPVTRRAVAALEHAASRAWPAPDQERLGEWVLRAAGGWSNRANSALPVGDPGLPLAAAIDQVRRWYAARGLPPRISVPLPLAAAVDAALVSRGWMAGQPVLVQTACLADLLPLAGDSPRVTLTESPTPEWLALAASHARHASGGSLPPIAIEVLTGGGRLAVRFAHVYDEGGRLRAAGRGTVTGEGGHSGENPASGERPGSGERRWLGLSRMAVDPPARRQGLARQVVAALATWADQAGATDAFLQVEADNAAALALYARLGFTDHHRYVTRTATH